MITKSASRPAFTLVELLLTITIIGLLLAAGSVGVAKSRKNARDATRLGYVATLAQAADAYANTEKRYPDTTSFDASSCRVTDSNLQKYLPSSLTASKNYPQNGGTGCYTYVVNLGIPLNQTTIDNRSVSLADYARIAYLFRIFLEQDPTSQSLVNGYQTFSQFQQALEQAKGSLTYPNNILPSSNTARIVYWPGTYCGTKCPGEF